MGIMKKSQANRKARFKAALALDGTTQKEWAGGQELTVQHIAMTLRGERESKKLIDAIDSYIQGVEKKSRRRYGAFTKHLAA